MTAAAPNLEGTVRRPPAGAAPAVQPRLELPDHGSGPGDAGSTREVLLRSRLVEVLQTRRYEYKGQSYPLSSSGIEQIVRELSALSLAEGLLPANERLYGKLALGITVTEFMPDGRSTSRRFRRHRLGRPRPTAGT